MTITEGIEQRRSIDVYKRQVQPLYRWLGC